MGSPDARVDQDQNRGAPPQVPTLAMAQIFLMDDGWLGLTQLVGTYARSEAGSSDQFIPTSSVCAREKIGTD